MIYTGPYGDEQPIRPELETPLFNHQPGQLQQQLAAASEQIRSLLNERAMYRDQAQEHEELQAHYCQHVKEMDSEIRVLRHQLDDLERAVA